MTRIDVVEGFFGAGKTTFIKKILEEGVNLQSVVFLKCSQTEGELDAAHMKSNGIHSFEMKTDVKDEFYEEAVKDSLINIIDLFEPERILIETAGNTSLSRLLNSIQMIVVKGKVNLGFVASIVDAVHAIDLIEKYPHMMREQIENAHTIVLNQTEKISKEELYACEIALRKFTNHATFLVKPWEMEHPVDFRNSVEITSQLQSVVRNVAIKEDMNLVYDYKRSVAQKVEEEAKEIDSLMFHTDTIYTISKAENVLHNLLENYPHIIRIKADLKAENQHAIHLEYTNGMKDIKEIEYKGIGNIQLTGKRIPGNLLSFIE